MKCVTPNTGGQSLSSELVWQLYLGHRGQKSIIQERRLIGKKVQPSLRLHRMLLKPQNRSRLTADQTKRVVKMLRRKIFLHSPSFYIHISTFTHQPKNSHPGYERWKHFHRSPRVDFQKKPNVPACRFQYFLIGKRRMVRRLIHCQCLNQLESLDDSLI